MRNQSRFPDKYNLEINLLNSIGFAGYKHQSVNLQDLLINYYSPDMVRIETTELFPELSKELIQLLKRFDTNDWLLQSPVNGRTVKDLASHLLDGSLRRLSQQRDNFVDPSGKLKINSYSDLVDFIQALNKDWILATRRLSPGIIIDLLEYSETQLYLFFKSLDPDEKALFQVAWAGQSESSNWFDIAREFTEKWHHQMQIRMALGKPLLMDKKYSIPLYETFMLGLPFLFKEFIDYAIDTTLKIIINGNIHRTWFLIKKANSWILKKNNRNKIVSEVFIPANIGWIIFTKTDRDKEKYKNQITITGDIKLGEKVLDLVTVMS